MKRLLLFLALAAVAAPASASESTLRSKFPSDTFFKDHGTHFWIQVISPAAKDTNLVHSTLAGSTSAGTTWTFTAAENLVFNEGVPGRARSVQLTISGVDANIDGAVDPTVTGLNLLGETITETFDVTENTPATIVGIQAFASLTSMTLPAQDGANVYLSAGKGNYFGFPMTLSSTSQVPIKLEANADEAMTIAVDFDEIEKNTWIPTGTVPDGAVDYALYVILPPFASTAALARTGVY